MHGEHRPTSCCIRCYEAERSMQVHDHPIQPQPMMPCLPHKQASKAAHAATNRYVRNYGQK